MVWLIFSYGIFIGRFRIDLLLPQAASIWTPFRHSFHPSQVPKGSKDEGSLKSCTLDSSINGFAPSMATFRAARARPLLPRAWPGPGDGCGTSCASALRSSACRVQRNRRSMCPRHKFFVANCSGCTCLQTFAIFIHFSACNPKKKNISVAHHQFAHGPACLGFRCHHWSSSSSSSSSLSASLVSLRQCHVALHVATVVLSGIHIAWSLFRILCPHHQRCTDQQVLLRDAKMCLSHLEPRKALNGTTWWFDVFGVISFGSYDFWSFLTVGTGRVHWSSWSQSVVYFCMLRGQEIDGQIQWKFDGPIPRRVKPVQKNDQSDEQSWHAAVENSFP